MKWYWKILIGLIIFFTGAYFGIDYFAESIIENRIQKLKKQVEDLYEINYKSLNVSLVERKIVLREFEFKTHVDSFYNSNKYDFKIDKLQLRYDKYLNIITNHSVDIIEVVLREPEISYGIRSHLKGESKKDQKNENETTEKSDSTKRFFLEKITLEQLKIESGKVDLYNIENPDQKNIFINDFDVDVEEFVYDLVKDSFYISKSSTKRLFSFKEIYKNDLKKHDLSIDEIQYHLETKELEITNFHFENKETPKEYRKTLSYRAPWFSINVPHIRIKINPRYIYDTGLLYIPMIEVADAKVTIDNDLNFPIKPGHKPMPAISIASMKLNFLIDSLLVSNAELNYLHKAEAAEGGFLKFSNLNTTAQRITDIDSLIAINPFVDMKVSAKFWDEGSLNVNYRLDISSPTGRMDVAGSLENMAFKKAENMIKPLYGVEVRSGHIDQLAFDFVMDENIGKGKLKFDYRDLKLDIKAEDKEQKKESDEAKFSEKNKGVLSFVVNGAIRPSNIPGDKKYKEDGNIIVDRTKFKPFFDLMWNSIMVGMMDIAVKDAFYNSVKNYEKKQKKDEKQAEKEEKKDEKKKKEKKGVFKKKDKD